MKQKGLNATTKRKRNIATPIVLTNKLTRPHESRTKLQKKRIKCQYIQSALAKKQPTISASSCSVKQILTFYA